ncbi:dsRBD fold-containing protein [Mycolicibacterium litorale]|uniref:dsRBD fold-containing protein n=1 Tax=Mycolicibacterium litorale TaxID=758802 RepID=UPI003CF6E61E
MYDKDLTTRWHVDIEFSEDDVHTHATLRARMDDDRELTATGDSYRNPRDSSRPIIGEEIAAARALLALGTDLLQTASHQIEEAVHRPVHLSR